MPNNNSKKSTKKTSENKNLKTKKLDNKTKKTIDSKKTKKGKKAHPKLILALKILLVIFLLLCVIGAGIIAAMMFGLFGDDFDITKDELTIGISNSIVLDKDGNEIANLSTDEKRKIISLSEMSDYLPKAYIAIEDKRFYSHNGVDVRRTAGAILGAITGTDRGGGSSITQQLVKNITNQKARSGLAGIVRKMKEWSKAVQVERMISKDQILELYLNVIFVGGDNIHGVELGSIYYFNKNAKDLDLAECAFLAGINNSPNKYNPYDTEEDHSELIKTRTLTVLKEMKTQGYITNEDEYNAAVAKVEAGLTFTKGNTSSNYSYSYHTQAAVDQVIKQVMEEKGLSRDFAEKYVYSSGLKIYSTQDTTIQARVEEETKKNKYIVSGKDIDEKTGKLKNEHTQAAFVIIDHTTGNVVGCSGGLGQREGSTLNRATQSVRQPGSAIKPIADIAPALQEKVITASTVYDDVLTEFGGNYHPKNDGRKYRGLINIRQIIAYSQNVPEVKIMRELTPGKSIDYLRKFGISTLYKTGEDKDKNDEHLPLAIGGISDGISPLEMAAAYAAIANDGVYIAPTFYTKVTDSTGSIVLTPTQEKTRVISEQNAYIVKSILKEPVNYGTATYCRINGIDVAAKTGTTDHSYDRWLCGITPYYAAACWYGYDKQEEVKWSGTNPAGLIWSNIMKDIHSTLEKKTFTKPNGIVDAKVCKVTGCLAVNSCTDTYTEMFTQDNLPIKCEGHGTQKICTESGKLANEYCPADKVQTQSYGGTIPKEKLGLWSAIGPSSKTGNEKIEETCTIHKKPEEKPKTNTITNTITNTVINTEKNNTTSEKNEVKNNTTNETNKITNTVTNTTNPNKKK